MDLIKVWLIKTPIHTWLHTLKGVNQVRKGKVTKDGVTGKDTFES